MITLATLGQATAQEVYNQVKEHLLTQRKQCAKGDTGCSYRNDDGLKCAAGALIADEEYLPEMDVVEEVGTAWCNLIERGLVPSTEHDALITSLQIVHDTEEVHHWETEIMRVAVEHNLQP